MLKLKNIIGSPPNPILKCGLGMPSDATLRCDSLSHLNHITSFTFTGQGAPAGSSGRVRFNPLNLTLVCTDSISHLNHITSFNFTGQVAPAAELCFELAHRSVSQICFLFLGSGQYKWLLNSL